MTYINIWIWRGCYIKCGIYLSEISKLDINAKALFIISLKNVWRGNVSDIVNEVKENRRFSKGKYYPHYESDSVHRNSKYNGKQRYLNKNEEVKS